ncbi:MAG: apolipoprotein N-acyltransferase [Fimbriimonadaceae bacterium]|nr:apolipoprotein N-acyltransferase [Fimbriimonadaceae bacterium]
MPGKLNSRLLSNLLARLGRPRSVRRLGWMLGGVAVSGALLAFSLPPHRLSPLAWFAFVPVMLAVRGLGFAVGFACALSTCFLAAWLDAQGVLLRPGVLDGSPGWIYTGFALFGLVAAIAIGMWAASEKLRSRPWAIAAWAVLFEAALLVYLPAHMALSQSRSELMLGLASWTGIWGVSYLVWLANFGLAKLILEHRRRVAFALAAVCAGASLISLPAERGPLRIAFLQTRSTDPDELKALNARAGEMGARLVVWPELSGSVAVIQGRVDDLVSLAKLPGQPALVTSYEDAYEPLPHNVAQVFSASGGSPIYLKRKLFAGEVNMHSAGANAAAAQLAGTTYGLNICFDSCFPNVMRDTAALPDVGVILLPTLDPDTPYGVMQAIHAAYTPFRAAEIGLPIVRADITGHSMAFDARGRVLAEVGTEPDAIAIADIRPGKRWTFASILGDWFLLICGALALLGLRPRPVTS